MKPSLLHLRRLSHKPMSPPAPAPPDPAEILCKILSTTASSGLEAALDHSGVRPSPDVVLRVLSRFRNAGLLAYRFFRWSSSSSSGGHSVRAHHAVIESLGKIRQFELVWELVRSMKPLGLLTVETFCVIMRKYARAGKVDQALYSFNVIDKYGLEPNLAALDGLLSALCKSGHVTKAQEVFDSLKARFDPGPKSFSILIAGWGREPNLPRARQVFRDMIDRGVSPDAVTFGIMVDVLCKAGRVEEAVGVVESMASSNVPPSSFVYSVLVHAHGAEGRLGDAVAAFEEMERRGAEADVAAYNALVGAFVRAGEMDRAYALVREMRARPNSRTLNIVLSGLIGRGETGEAVEAFGKMVARGCEPDADTYTMMIKMSCGKGDSGRTATRVWRYMKRKGFVPGMHTYSVLINGLCREGQAERACVLMEEMIENGVRPAGPTFGRLKQLLVKEGRDDVVDFLQKKMSLLVKEPLCD